MIAGYQLTAAVKAGVELELFTAVGEGHRTAEALAQRCQASEKGMRVLADYFVVEGLLSKQDGQYGLLPDAAAFLDQKSPAYMGAMTQFMTGADLTHMFSELTAAVRKGGVAVTAKGSTQDHFGGWVAFAESMEAMMGAAAQQMAEIATAGREGELAVLDVAASHGLFGFSIAKKYPQAKVTALDWANVLEITKANAARWGLSERLETIAGDAFQVDLKGPYDVILLTNLLHHFPHGECVALLKRLKAALKPGGMVMTLEPVPNADRVSPPMPAKFALIMLASTPDGDAFPFAEFERMFAEAGFAESKLVELQMTPEALIVSR
jgi:protein-L-isoaspartate O-methyltransferase